MKLGICLGSFNRSVQLGTGGSRGRKRIGSVRLGDFYMVFMFDILDRFCGLENILS